MEVILNNPLVFLADFIAPLLIAAVCCLLWGPNRGILTAAVPALIAVLVLFYFQVSGFPGPDGPSRFEVAYGYMLDESVMWFASFMVGAAIGSVIWKRRQAR